MKAGLKRGWLALCMVVCLSGCGREPEEAATAAEAGTEAAGQSKIADSFPESYSEQTEKVKFECQLEVPENFEISNFHAPVIKGSAYIDPETVYAKYVEGNAVAEEHPDEAGNEAGGSTYILEDGRLIGATGGVIYYTQESARYRNVVRASERNAPKDNFAFATGESCMEQVIEELKDLGCPVEEYQFGWFSTSGEDYEILEQRALEDGSIDSRSVNPDGWTEADDAYEIYGWQTYEGLPVFPQWMTTAMSRALESYQKAPVSALFTEQGMLNLALTEPPYVFEASEEVLEFRPFPEIAEVLVRKYGDLLDDASYTVTRAKLALRTYVDEKQQMRADPVWYFEVTDGSAVEVALVNAVTAEEIFLI